MHLARRRRSRERAAAARFGIMSAGDWITTSTILDQLADSRRDDAWERFVGRFRRPVVGFARRMGLASEDAEDVAQDTLATFVEAYRAGRYDRARGRLSHWLFGIALRVALGKRRSLRRRARVLSAEPLDPEQAGGEGQAEEAWRAAWEKSLLQAGLARVRQEVEPMTMRAFELVVRGDRTAGQVADELGIPVKAVYNAKYTVLKRLRACRHEFEGVADESKENGPPSS